VNHNTPCIPLQHSVSIHATSHRRACRILFIPTVEQARRKFHVMQLEFLTVLNGINILSLAKELNVTIFLCPPQWGAYSILWSVGLIYQFLDHSQTVGLLGRVISSSQGLYLNTGNPNTEKRTHTSNIHALIGTRTHDPGLRASEDSTCLRPLGYRDRQYNYIISKSNFKF
jgi:hypothetical protein